MLGSIGVLVNNAAIQGPIGPLWQNSWDQWEAAIRVNLLTPSALCAAVVPLMRVQGGGKIINLSGGGATSARPNFTAYACAKTAIVRLTETLAVETRGMDVDVNCVAPGAMPTDMLREIIAAGSDRAGESDYGSAVKAGNSQEQGDAVIRDAADLCVFLASRLSDGVSGRLISARWDDWRSLPEYKNDLMETDVFTLRRILPQDRGRQWGEKT
jgi:3-oxoacyl-[acyl-carrier protein] reductase